TNRLRTSKGEHTVLALHVAKPVVARKKNSRRTFSFCRFAQLPGSSSLARVRRASYLEPQHFRSRVLDCITTAEAVWLPSAGRGLVSICRFVRDRSHSPAARTSGMNTGGRSTSVVEGLPPSSARAIESASSRLGAHVKPIRS